MTERACAASAGFLPTFGPAYINFYGGPRTFKLVYDDYYKRLDQGIGEGLCGPMEQGLPAHGAIPDDGSRAGCGFCC